jgi:NADP-dependent 3-hydroxy acid dehydrogenase YdfG
MTGSLAGRVALVTGASAGIGRAIAIALANEGAEIIATARREAELQSLADDCRESAGSVRHIAGDLNDPEFVATLAKQAGDVDILVNNAGTLTYAPLLELPPSDSEAMFRINVLATINLSQAIGKAMAARRRGHIVMMTSLSARSINRFGAVYGATKHALSGIAKGLRVELKGIGIKVTEIAPGMVDTDIRNSSTHPEVIASIEARTYAPLTPQDVAAAVVYAVTTSDNCCPDLIELRPVTA